MNEKLFLTLACLFTSKFNENFYLFLMPQNHHLFYLNFKAIATTKAMHPKMCVMNLLR